MQTISLFQKVHCRVAARASDRIWQNRAIYRRWGLGASALADPQIGDVGRRFLRSRAFLGEAGGAITYSRTCPHQHFPPASWNLVPTRKAV